MTKSSSSSIAAAYALAAFTTLVATAPAHADIAPDGGEIHVNTFTADDQTAPAVARLPDGGFVVVWQSFDQLGGVDHDVFGRRFDAAGAPLGAVFQVNAYTSDDQIAPRVSAADDGTFLVVWQSFAQAGGLDYDVYARLFNASGAAVGADVRVNNYTLDDQSRPAVTTAPDGSFLVVWQSFDQAGGFDLDVYGRRLSAAGATAGAEFRVNAATADDQQAPSVAAAPDGTFVVAWQNFGAQTGDDEIFSRVFTAAAAPVAAAKRVNAATDGDQTLPVAAAASDGTFVIAWQTYDASGFDAGVSARRVDGTAQPLGGEIAVNATTDGDQIVPSIAMDDAGAGFVVAWASLGQDDTADPTSFGVIARAFDASGAPLGGETIVNETTSDDQEQPAVAALGAGGFAVAWQSFGQEGALDAGIWARRYSSSGGTCGDFTGDGTLSASDALGALNTAVGLGTCQLCVCDVDQSGSVVATDALLVLTAAVGLPVPIHCATC